MLQTGHYLPYIVSYRCALVQSKNWEPSDCDFKFACSVVIACCSLYQAGTKEELHCYSDDLE